MAWNIAQAKQHFSELVRATGDAPQVITNRDKPVAVLVTAAQMEEYETLKAAQQARETPTLGQILETFRQACIDEDWDFPEEAMQRGVRPNAFADMIEEEGDVPR